LRERWPGENFIYLADTARLPYGNKSLHTIHNYVEQCLKVLREYQPKAVVVACNSASTAILEQPVKFDVPVFNVVEPGARKALDVSVSKRIGVLGTRATVYSEAYLKAIRKLDASAQVYQQPCPLWVPLVEEGWTDDPVTNLIVYRYASTIVKNNIDTLILGCTHFPVLKDSIKKAVGPAIQLVDSSQGLIEDLSAIEMNGAPDGGSLKILCTDFSPRLEETIRMLLKGAAFDSLETIDLKP
jgi:glutamate racemase